MLKFAEDVIIAFLIIFVTVIVLNVAHGFVMWSMVPILTYDYLLGARLAAVVAVLITVFVKVRNR